MHNGSRRYLVEDPAVSRIQEERSLHRYGNLLVETLNDMTYCQDVES